MLKQILASVGVNVILLIPEVTDILYFINISTNSASNKTHTPTYYHFHRPFLPQNKGKKNRFHTRNIWFHLLEQ